MPPRYDARRERSVTLPARRLLSPRCESGAFVKQRRPALAAGPKLLWPTRSAASHGDTRGNGRRGHLRRGLREVARFWRLPSLLRTSKRGTPFTKRGFQAMVERAGEAAGLGLKIHPHMR
jgi:hypothetical protein